MMRRVLVLLALAAAVVGAAAFAGDFYTNETNTIFVDKVPSRSLPDGADPRQFGRAQDWNGLKGAAIDLRTAGKAQDARADGHDAALATLAARLTAVENALGDEVIPVIQAPAPTASPTPGTYSTGQDVTLGGCPGGTIRYTLNDTVPTGSSTAYTAALDVDVTTTIFAICQQTGKADSGVSVFGYAIQAAGTPLAFHAQGSGYDDTTGDTVPASVTTTAVNTTLVACASHAANTGQSDHAPTISSTGGLTWTPRGSAVMDEEFRAYLYTAPAPSAGSYTVTWDANTSGEVGKALAVTAWTGVTGFGTPVSDTTWTANVDPLAVSLTPSASGSAAIMCGAMNGSRALTLTGATSSVQNQREPFGATLFAGRSAASLTAGSSVTLGSSAPAMPSARNAAIIMEILGNAGGTGGLDPQPTTSYPETRTLVASSQPTLAEPALLATVPYTDLGTSVTRVSNSPTHYATDNPWNADESLFMLGNGAVLHGTSFASIYGARNVPAGGYRWGNTTANKNKVFGANRDASQWAVLDVTTNVRTTLYQYTAGELGVASLSTVDLGLSGDGGFDNNDQWAALVANEVKPFVASVATGEIKCIAAGGPLVGSSALTIESARMSQDGNWLLVSFISRASDGSKGVDAFRVSDCTWHRRLTVETSHFDTCVSSSGDQVIVQAYGGATMVRISDGQTTTVDPSPRHHVSCTNRQRPGWVYLSTYNRPCDATVMAGPGWHKIYATKLDGSGQIQQFAWDHSPCGGDYSNEASAAASPTGTRVAWKARWSATPTGAPAGDLHSFVAGK